MLPKETAEVKKLQNTHVFMTNKIFSEVQKSVKYDTYNTKSQFLNFTDSMRLINEDLIEIFRNFESKQLEN